LLLRPPASRQHLGASNQEARIDACGPPDQAEYHDGADPNAAAAARDAARPTAPILNSLALR
jgi:hypothetical protein